MEKSKNERLAKKIFSKEYLDEIKERYIGLITDPKVLEEYINLENEDKPSESLLELARRRYKYLTLSENKENIDKSLYTAYKIIAECPHCGQNTPIYSFEKEQKCMYCYKEFEYQYIIHIVNTDNWKDYETFEIDYEDDLVHYPKCSNCSENLVDAGNAKPGDSIICSNCTTENPTYLPPKWMEGIIRRSRETLKKYTPALVIHFPNGEILDIKEGREPIKFECKGCSATLEINPKTPRVLDCQYCGTDQYLPDDLWSEFHPVPLKKEIYIRWDRIN